MAGQERSAEEDRNFVANLKFIIKTQANGRAVTLTYNHNITRAGQRRLADDAVVVCRDTGLSACHYRRV